MFQFCSFCCTKIKQTVIIKWFCNLFHFNNSLCSAKTEVQGCQMWLISRQVAYFHPWWRLKIGGVKPPKMWLILKFRQMWLKCGLNSKIKGSPQKFLPAAAGFWFVFSSWWLDCGLNFCLDGLNVA